jgi:adenylate cyclase
LPEEKCPSICLAGNEGSGKTATAQQMLSILEESFSNHKKPLLTLNVQCEENQTSPYYPIQQALFEYVNIGGNGPDDEDMGEIEDVLDGLLGNFIPFAGLITPGKREKKNAFNTQTELFISIFKTLTELSKKHSLIFFVDDLQWADGASVELLKFLHDRFTEKSCYNIMFLYTSRPCANIDKLFVSRQIVTLTPLSLNERLQLLTLDMGIERESAGFILQWTGDQNRGKGGMFWLYKILEQLARNGHLHESKQGLKLSDAILQSQNLPIPEDYRKTLRGELNKLHDNKKYLAVAACMGMEFEVSILASALGVDRLECLQALQYMEKETSLIIDRPEKDDIFAFTSSFTLECIRQELELSHQGPRGAVKQIVREYHARLAAIIEKETPEGNTLRLARHYYAAGKKHAPKAITFLIAAARQCADVFRFDEAREYLVKVSEVAAFVENPHLYDLDILLVECRISTLEGKDFALVAQKCDSFLKHNPETQPRCLILFAQIQYYAHKFPRAIELCQWVIKNTSDTHLLAQAHHLMGISIDFEHAAQRLEHLQKAMELMGSINDQNTQVLRTLGTLHNSLGEEYSKKANTNSALKATALAHFEKSIEIKSLKQINDTPGLARSYGGLGRLEMTIKPVNIEKALEYFQKDLELAQQTGDMLGQIVMHSSMGNCYLLLNESGKAKTAYEQSLNLSERPSDKAFALMGLLKIYDSEPDADWGERTIEALKNILMQQDFVPQYFLKKELTEFFTLADKKDKYKAHLEQLYR